jgi:DNA-directed RNA polymerase subunit beta
VKIDEALQAYRRKGDMTPVREAMRIGYGDETYAAFEGMEDEALVEAAANVTGGVPIATPVFDGAKEADVNDALRRPGFDTSASRSSTTAAPARPSRGRSRWG